MTDFQIRYDWRPRAHETPLVEEYLQDDDPLWSALKRFTSRFEGRFTVPLEPDPLTLELDDVPMVFDDLPDWLNGLATGDARKELLFASQGTELKLVAERSGDLVRLHALSIAPDLPLSATHGPVVAPAGRFLNAWADFVLTLLNALVLENVSLVEDAGFVSYRDAIARVKSLG